MKIGIVGTGTISTHHLKAISRYPGCDIVGVVDRDLARARAQAERFSVPHAFETLPQLLALQPDVVHVLTPPDSHALLAVEALAAGAHVYVEKPMAITVSDCDTMIRAAARADRQLCVGHCWNYIPVIARAQSIIASGAAGELVQVAASFNYDVLRNPTFGQGHWSSALPGGLAEDLAVHLVSVLIRLLGAPQRTSAMSRSGGQIAGAKAEDVRAVLEGERGLGTFSVSLRGRPDMILIDIWCTRMLLRLNVSCMSLMMYRQLPVPQAIGRGLANLDVAAQLVSGTVGATWKLLRRKVDGSYGITPCIHAFYDALAAGQPSPIDPHEGAQAVAVLRSLWPTADDAHDSPRLAEGSAKVPAPAHLL
jgi:predicted dehydrogenase